MGKYFGTDGVRGIANQNLTAELAYRLGVAGAYVLTKHYDKSKLVIGKDTRLSCDMLQSAMAAGILSVGADILYAGVVPTPAVSFLTRLHQAEAGVVISASHNPCEQNGIKFFNKSGNKLSDDIEEEIEYYIDNISEVPLASPFDIGHCKDVDISPYLDFLCECASGSLEGMRIALDCANGAAYAIAPAVFKRLGADITCINTTPDGANINKDCGSTHMGGLCELVKSGGYDMGFAFDGDCDRALCVDENGEIVDGDKIMLIIADDLKKQGKLNHNTIVATVMSNLGMFKAAEKMGINILKTPVGDKYVLQEMQQGGYSVGGEQSGHIILPHFSVTGDGTLTALCIAEIARGKKVSHMAKIMTVYPQILVNVRDVDESRLSAPEVVDEIKRIEEILDGNGRLLIRKSGTEPLIRIMIEGEDQDTIKSYANLLADKIKN